MLEFEENPLPPPNYPISKAFFPYCCRCGKLFETAWHIAVHQWNCEKLNQAIKDQEEGIIK